MHCTLHRHGTNRLLRALAQARNVTHLGESTASDVGVAAGGRAERLGRPEPGPAHVVREPHRCVVSVWLPAPVKEPCSGLGEQQEPCACSVPAGGGPTASPGHSQGALVHVLPGEPEGKAQPQDAHAYASTVLPGSIATYVVAKLQLEAEHSQQGMSSSDATPRRAGRATVAGSELVGDMAAPAARAQGAATQTTGGCCSRAEAWHHVAVHSNNELRHSDLEDQLRPVASDPQLVRDTSSISKQPGRFSPRTAVTGQACVKSGSSNGRHCPMIRKESFTRGMVVQRAGAAVEARRPLSALTRGRIAPAPGPEVPPRTGPSKGSGPQDAAVQPASAAPVNSSRRTSGRPALVRWGRPMPSLPTR
mmetsp:Transcript_35482/g.101317  ORF Transcript_35482/g.101317 Transcript_35482/m.101317 type:complete len:363 (-) Transcript_35482:32-1120(-)